MAVNEVLESELLKIRNAFLEKEGVSFESRYVLVAARDWDNFPHEWLLVQKLIKDEEVDLLHSVFPDAIVKQCLWVNFFTLYYGIITPFEARAIMMMKEVKLSYLDESFNRLAEFVVRPAEVL